MQTSPRLDIEALPGPRPASDDAPDDELGRVDVEVVNRPSLVPGLSAALPDRWAVRGVVDPSRHSDQEGFVVLWNAYGEQVSTARRRRPRSDVVVLLDRQAAPSMVVEAMEAGAAACIREPTAALIASYLLRLHLRSEASGSRQRRTGETGDRTPRRLVHDPDRGTVGGERRDG